MSNKLGQPTHTTALIHRLRLMADSGGMLTRDRIKTIIESADRLEELDERVAIMTEDEPLPDHAHDFPFRMDDTLAEKVQDGVRMWAESGKSFGEFFLSGGGDKE